MRHFYLSLAFLLVAGLLPTNADAVILSFDLDDFTTAAKNGESPATSGQFAGELYIRERANNNNPELEVEAFLGFDLSSISPGATILSATLVLHQNNKLNSVNSADMFIARVLEDWDSSGNDPVFAEETVPNDGAGGITDVADEFLFGNNGPANAGPAVDIEHTIDVTTWTQLWVADPSSNHGVRLRLDDAFVGAAFFDTTGADRVQLIVNAVPEPSTYLVFGGLMLCFGAAGWWRKRRTR